MSQTIVPNSNTRNFETFMKGLERGAGEGRFGLVHGAAGRGKTRAAITWHAEHRQSLYLKCNVIWSPKAFLARLLYELGASGGAPWSAAACYDEAAGKLAAAQEAGAGAVLFLDEIDLLPSIFLKIARNLADDSGAAVILIGESELPGQLWRESRVSSRVMECLEFLPLSRPELVSFCRARHGLELAADSAEVLHRASGGDLRDLSRFAGALKLACDGRKPSAEEARTIVESLSFRKTRRSES